ncbi:hypothetical protein WDU94_002412 [Cyamophila willieti]
MVSMKQVCKFMEMTGLINMHRHKSRRRDYLQNIYIFVQMGLFLLFLLCHMLNVLTRAVRYFPEFLQTLLENMVFLYLIIYTAHYQLRYRGLNYFIDQIDNTFSKADTKIIQKYHRLSDFICAGLITVVCNAVVCLFVETIIPISPDEVEIRRFVYRTEHPERKLPVNIRIPFLDETKSWTYEMIYAMLTYVLTMYGVWVGLLTSMVPITVIHLQGQYEILCKYILMIGQEHRDYAGNRIFYTNIESNEFVWEPVKRRPRQIKMKRILREKTDCYKQNFMRQILRFHQRLITFQAEVSTLYSKK